MYQQFECLTQNDSATFIFAFDLFEFKTNNNNEINFKIEYAHAIAQILHLILIPYSTYLYLKMRFL